MTAGAKTFSPQCSHTIAGTPSTTSSLSPTRRSTVIVFSVISWRHTRQVIGQTYSLRLLKSTHSVGSIPRSLLRTSLFPTAKSPSFPNASIGNPGEILTGPPIKTFGGDNFGINSQKRFLYFVSLLRKIQYFAQSRVDANSNPRTNPRLNERDVHRTLPKSPYALTASGPNSIRSSGSILLTIKPDGNLG